MADLDLRILLSAVGAAGVTSAIGSITSALGSGGLSAALAATGVAAAGLAVGFGVTAVKAAGDFNASLTSLVTGAGEAQKNIGMVSNGMLDMAVQTGTSTKQLTDGMYLIESAGFHGADGLQVLKAAAEGAKVGNADLGTVANATTTILTDYHMSASQAASATSGLVATVASGKTHLQDLSSAMSTVLPLASSVHVGFSQVGAAMATMTNGGETAQHAGQMVAFMLRDLVAPSSKAAKEMQSVGLSATDVANTLQNKGLPQALQMIEDHVGKKFPEGSAEWTAAMKQIMGGAMGLNGVLELGGANMKTFVGNVSSISSAMQNGSKDVQGWAQVQQDFNFRLAQGKEVLETLSIRIGQALLPYVSQLLGHIFPLVTAFSDWMTKSNVLQGAISSLSPVVGNVKNVIVGLSPLVATIGNAIQTIAVPAFQIFKQALSGAQAAATPIIAAIQSSLIPALQNLIGVIVPVVAGLLQWVANSGAVPAIMSAIGSTVTFVVNVLSGLINGLASVVKFFTQTELGGALLKATLVTLGIVLGVIAAAVIPPLIAGLVAMGIAAVTTGIEMAIAFAPVVIPILAIIAIVTAVILIVQHWGQIAHWLQGVWQGALDGIKTAWSAITAFFSGLWKGIQQVFANVGGWFHDRFQQAQQGAKSGWDNVTSFFHGVGDNIHTTWQTTAQNTVKSFQWLYNHNYYFKDLCDFIMHVSQAVQSWLHSAWTNTVSFISTQWSRLVGFASSLWGNLTSTIRMLVAAVVAWLQGAWEAASTFISSKWTWLSGLASSIWSDIYNTVSSLVSRAVQFLQEQWGRLAGFAQNAWQNVSNVFSSAWGTYIAGPLSSLGSSISGWFSNLAGQAIQWGANIINSIAQGINNAAGAVGDAAANVAGKIHDLLGFHSPAKKGPGADADKWMPNLINMLSHDLIMNSPQLGLAAQYAAQALATPLATGFRADPYTRADQLSFSTPTMIYSGASRARETSAERKREEERKKEERKLAEEHKKEARKAAEAEKKRVHADIHQIKAELHIHTSNAHLSKAQINEIVDQAMHQFGRKIGDEIRAQFGNV